MSAADSIAHSALFQPSPSKRAECISPDAGAVLDEDTSGETKHDEEATDPEAGNEITGEETMHDEEANESEAAAANDPEAGNGTTGEETTHDEEANKSEAAAEPMLDKDAGATLDKDAGATLDIDEGATLDNTVLTSLTAPRCG